MTDRRFYLLLTLLVLTLAAGEVVYAMVGPLSVPTHQIDELSINRVRWTIPSSMGILERAAQKHGPATRAAGAHMGDGTAPGHLSGQAAR